MDSGEAALFARDLREMIENPIKAFLKVRAICQEEITGIEMPAGQRMMDIYGIVKVFSTGS